MVFIRTIFSSFVFLLAGFATTVSADTDSASESKKIYILQNKVLNTSILFRFGERKLRYQRFVLDTLDFNQRIIQFTLLAEKNAKDNRHKQLADENTVLMESLRSTGGGHFQSAMCISQHSEKCVMLYVSIDERHPETILFSIHHEGSESSMGSVGDFIWKQQPSPEASLNNP